MKWPECLCCLQNPLLINLDQQAVVYPSDGSFQ
jgi:hypothetical protein